jgi:hypothetical protein
LAVSGIMIPLAVFSSASIGWTSTLSASGLILTLPIFDFILVIKHFPGSILLLS